MPAFSERSLKRLNTCDPLLILLCTECIKHFDFSVLEGHRTAQRQHELYLEGKSKLDGKYKKSKHQESPSQAVDLMPYPPELHGANIWDDMNRWALFIGRIRGIADMMGIEIRCGIDWDGDMSLRNNRFIDAPHIETLTKKPDVPSPT